MDEPFDIGDLRCFVASVRAGSMTRGAAALGTSQPALSKRIQRLERLVRKPVLLRDRRGTTPTAAGEVLLAYAERLLAIHDEARSTTRSGAAPTPGRRTLGLLEDLAITSLPTTLADFGALHPEVDLEVVVGTAAALRRLAERGRLDLALGDPTVMPEAAVRWKRQVDLVWSFTSNLDTSQDPLPLVLFSRPCRWRQPLLDALNHHGRQWRIAFQSTSVHAVQAAIGAGIGVGALLPTNAPRLPRPAELAGLPPAPTVEIAVSRRAGTEHDAAVSSLEALLVRSVTTGSRDEAA